MLKQQLVQAVSEEVGLTRKSAGAAIEAMLKIITNSLTNGEDVLLTGFGKFTVRNRAARTGRNPQTGAQLKIAATKTPAFRAGKALKSAVK